MSRSGHNGGPITKGGWIAVTREMRDHWIVGFGKPVTPADPSREYVMSRAEAWIDLLMECRYEDGTVLNAGRKMQLLRGSMLGAISYLAARWNWTPKTVRVFLDKLEADGMIILQKPGINQGSSYSLEGKSEGRQKGTQAQIITACNYDIYNPPQDGEGHAQGQEEGTQRARKGHAKGMKHNKGTMEQDIPPTPQGGRMSYRDIARQAFREYCDLAARCGLPLPREASFNDSRAKSILARMTDHAGANASPDEMLEVWRLGLANVERSKFLRGGNDKGFRADLTFLLQAKSFTRLIEGGYGNGAHATPAVTIDTRSAEERRAEVRALVEGAGYEFIPGEE